VRLRRLRIEEFKNLRDFTIAWPDQFTTVLVGPNGTGKSNLLEALIIIFRDLDLGTSPALTYSLEYECRGALVTVEANATRGRGTISATVDAKPVTARQLSRRGGGEYLPSFVFGYYSGPSNRMEDHFRTHQRNFADDLLKGADQPLRPLLYARLVHSQFVLLSFFQSDLQDRSILQDYLRITDLESVLFALKRPYWYNVQRRSSAGDADPRFWGARGVVQDFLQRLHELALAPLRSRVTDRFYLYLPSKQQLLRLAEGYGSQQEFFKALESLYISDLIHDVRTSVQISNVGSALTFRELSEGEQQLLMVLGMLRFVETKEGLILLDEPDTHLNPAWSQQYIRLLRNQVVNVATTQVIMATHDPLVVANLTAEEVILMQRSAGGEISAAHPDVDPKGMGIAGLLTSEVYGLRSPLDLDTLDELDQKRRLSIKDDLTTHERQELALLNEKLGPLDLTRSVRDPLYRAFVDAMTRAERRYGLQGAVLTRDQQARREEIARAVTEEFARRLAGGDEDGE